MFVRKFLMDLLGLLRNGIDDINVGMLQFSEVGKTRILMDLGKYPMEEQMKEVDTMVYQAGRQTMTGNALTMVADKVGITLKLRFRPPSLSNLEQSKAVQTHLDHKLQDIHPLLKNLKIKFNCLKRHGQL